jgi:hypothetical protein
MRTTLTLDDDNAVRLERLRKARDASLKDVVNEAIRRGLNAMAEPPPTREPFLIRAMNLGTPQFETAEELKALIRRMGEEDDLAKLGRT